MENQFWQIIYRTGEEDFQSREIIVNNNQYKQIQDAMRSGEDFIILENNPTIKRTSIVSINPADGIISPTEKEFYKSDSPQLETPKQERLSSGFKKIKIEFVQCIKCKKERIPSGLRNGLCFPCENN